MPGTWIPKADLSATIAILAGLILAFPAHAEDAITMKLSTATVNDHQHEWMRRFAAAVEKDSGGRIKGEVYPNSQLGSIPRQVEGTQFGSIQGWVGPPEFLVGVDERYETLSAPGLFTSREQDFRSINDPVVRDLMLGLGANKGLMGVGIFPVGPSSIIMRKPVRHLAEFKGTKIRVLASPFQLELIKRMDGSPVAMSLADVLPAMQQGTIDGALATMTIYNTMHDQDAAKYITETDQPWINSIAVLSKKWFDGLPDDLKKIVRDDATAVTVQMAPFTAEFLAAQRKAWTDSGGELISLPAAEQAAIGEKIASIGLDMSQSKPALNEAVKLVVEAAARNK
jgi:TRAP-type C4-dicarboxylate transport system substrate-binding protein